jgi:tetratricopeptide (TPR) repeat protein/tRNA A-37 threonylcarbamoyl transferase component Bud32
VKDRIGHYRILKELGQGGMGAVFLAQDEALGRRVALKVLRRPPSPESDDGERFRREGRALAKVAHPNVTAVLEAGEAQGTSYLALELVEGGDLARRIKEGGRLPWRTAARYASEVADGLEAIHAAGLVHRDLKPANVLLDRSGRVKLTDFGLSRDAGVTRDLTRTGTVVGTLEYLSPEQANAEEKLDDRSDLYSLGVVLYEMLTGERPFHGTPLELLHKHLTEAPRPPRSLVPEIPEALDALVLRLLAKKPDDRPAAAGRVAEELRGLLRKSGGAPRPSRARAFALSAAVVTVLLAAGLTALHAAHDRKGPAPTPPTATIEPASVSSAATVARRTAPPPPPPYLPIFQPGPGTPGEHLTRGLDHFAKHELDAALAEANAALELEPDRLGALELKVRVLRRMGRFEEAIPARDKAVEALHWQANESADKRRYEEARDAFDRILALNPGDASAHDGRANILVWLGRADEGLEEADRTIELEPQNPLWWRSRARLRRHVGDFAGAADDLGRHCELVPDSAEAWRDLANARIVIKDLGNALAASTRAVQCDRSFESLSQHSGICFMINQLAQAEADATAALALEPGSAGAFEARAHIRVVRGDLERALDDARMAIQIDPRRSQSWEVLAQVQMRRKELDAALEALTKAIELDPRSDKLLAERAEVHHLLKDAAGERADFEAAEKLDPRNEKYKSRLAALAALGH